MNFICGPMPVDMSEEQKVVTEFRTCQSTRSRSKIPDA